MTAEASPYDLIICGAGAGGLTAAIRFGRQGRRVLLVDKLTDTVNTFKGELLQPISLVTLDSLGNLASLVEAGGRKIDRLVSSNAEDEELCSMDYRWLPQPYNHCITHTYKGILDNFIAILPPTVEFRRGVLIDHAIMDDSGRICGIELRDGKQRKREFAPLVVAADGYSSKLRTQVGIEISAVEYDHQVIAFDLENEPHLQSRANTVVTPEGMRVMYPMPHNGGRLYVQIPHGLVNGIGKRGLPAWMDRAIDACPALMPLTDSIHRSLPGSRVLSARRFVAPAFHGAGMPLIGDAAHAVHPMAGQGMNAAIADAMALADAMDGVDPLDLARTDVALAAYNTKRMAEVETLSEFSHRFAELLTTGTRPGFARTRYILNCHGRNQRLCYKIMHNISGLGYQRFTMLDRLQQVGFPDRHAARVPALTG
jgi:2-polyprenyl-6-methoxyphenol hydroxylase-like FAD-dependent oxidoreductase